MTSRSTKLTSLRSTTMFRESVRSLKSRFNSASARVSMWPLRTNTLNFPREAVSILKLMSYAFPWLDQLRRVQFCPGSHHEHCQQLRIELRRNTTLEDKIW